jgi:SAM-dependent methyltransferase
MTILSVDALSGGPLVAHDRDLAAAFRRVLEIHGFASDAVLSAFGNPIGATQSHVRIDLPVYLKRLSSSSPLHTLIKLFVLDQWVEDEAVQAATAPVTVADLRDLGLVETGARGVRAVVRLSAYDGLVISHDRYDGSSLGRDHVLNVNPTTVALASVIVRRKVGSALDIGTGGGALALVAARHCERVIGVDTNPRALNLAAFNAALNGVDNVEWRLGSLFEPVAGSRFDLIFSNPPYVISPESRFVFRDSGRRGDAICQEIARSMPDYLTEGGFASMLCNWAIGAGGEWSAPPARWVADRGCDAWVISRGTLDPLTYAAGWNRNTDAAGYDDALERWTSYCDELGIASVGLGALILRRRTPSATAKNWIRSDVAHMPTGSCGPQIERIFAAEDVLRSAGSGDGRALLERRFRAAADHRLQQILALRDGAYATERAEIHLTDGFRFHGNVDAHTVRLLQLCDGSRPLAAIARELAQDGALTIEQAEAAAVDTVRGLLAFGFLE